MGYTPHERVRWGVEDDSLGVRLLADIRSIFQQLHVNPVIPDLLARASNRVRPVNREPLTQDSDVIKLRWLLIDCDPVRPSGISATDEEHDHAIVRARKIKRILSNEGWPEPILADSGNGAHLMYRVDLNPREAPILRACLEALAFQFDDSQVIVDQKVFNPARIWKLYGTTACKGDNVPDRPHRVSQILSVPDSLEIIVKLEPLQELAASFPPALRQEQPIDKSLANNFDLRRWIADHKVDVIGPTPWKDGQRWVFKVCPWDEGHTNRSAFIIQFSAGAITAGCHVT